MPAIGNLSTFEVFSSSRYLKRNQILSRTYPYEFKQGGAKVQLYNGGFRKALRDAFPEVAFDPHWIGAADSQASKMAKSKMKD